MAGLWPSFFLRFYIWTSTFFMDREEVENSQKKTRPISSNLGQANLVNKGFIVWLSGKCFLRDKAGCPERAR